MDEAATAFDAEPLSTAEGLTLLTQVLCNSTGSSVAGPLLLTVSGGPDSMAMLRLAADARAGLLRHGVEFHVATVDHGLRPASAFEAETVAQVSRDLGLPHRILRWAGAKPSSNLQGVARRVRYGLLEALGAEIGATAILTAHHQDDQIETHALAAERHAGDRGLAGMRMRRALAPGLDLVRPFLDVPASRMRATAAASGLPVFHDPSNDDPRYGRVRVRQALAEVDGHRRAEWLAAIARHRSAAARADHAIAAALADAGSGGADVDLYGRVHLARERLASLADDHRPELLGRILTAVTGAEHAPARPALERLSTMLLGTSVQAVTLGGVRIEPGPATVFAREYGRQGLATVIFGEASRQVLFDERFVVSVEGDERASSGLSMGGARLMALGALGRGDSAERTMPVLVDADGALMAVPAALGLKAPGVSGRLQLTGRVPFRLWADLPRVETA